MPSNPYIAERHAKHDSKHDVDDLELLAAEDDLMTSDSEQGETAASGSESDDEDDDDVPHEITEEHYSAIRTTVIEIVTALGGIEDIVNEYGDIEKVYVIGDDCLRCLRDLRTLLHQDQDDTTRVIPKIFSEVNVVQRGLLPLLLKTVDMGDKGTKIALACTDLLTSLTWPIDIVAEQQAALNQDIGTSPLQSYLLMQDVFVSYKSAILRLRSSETKGSQRSILASITLHILLPALSKSRHDRTPRDTGTIGMCLHLFRNLLAIRDPVATSLSGRDVIALSNLQNDLLVELKTAHVLDTILMLASNAESSDFEPWNIITAECVYHIYAGARPEHLMESVKETDSREPAVLQRNNSALLTSLAAESRQKSQEMLTSGTSRHSRYSTTISFRDVDGTMRVARSQRSLRKTPEELMLLSKEKQKRKRGRRGKKIDEVGAARMRTTWTPAAAKVASTWAKQFFQVGFESLARSVLKDIRSENFKVGNIDQTRTRFMRLAHIFLEYFLLVKAAKDAKTTTEGSPIDEDYSSVTSFAVVDYWLEPWALKMAWIRASTALDDKTWLEFVTAVQLWTTLLRLVEALARSPSQHDRDRAEGIQALHFYNELTLDAAKSVTRAFKTQSFRCLETVLDFAYVMPRMLERYSKDNDNLYVKLKRQARQSATSDGQVLSAQEEQEQVKQMLESQIKERRFEFQKFQSHLCTNQLMDACLAYLQRWQEVVNNTEQRMGGVLHVLHRLAVKASNLRLFYPHERRTALKKIQNDRDFWLFLQSKSSQVSDDMSKLFKYVLTRFEKLDPEEKALWSEGMKAPKVAKVFKMPPEIEIANSEGPLSDLHIAIGLLHEVNMISFATWLMTELTEVFEARRAIYDEELMPVMTDNLGGADVTFEDRAMARYSECVLSYHNSNRVREEASTRPEAKLLCRLVGLKSIEDDDHHWKWVAPTDLCVVKLGEKLEWMETDIIRISDVGPPEVPYSSKVKRKSRAATTRRQVVINEFGDEEDVHVPRARGIGKTARGGLFLEDDMIEDSDEEIELAGRMLALQRSGQVHDEADGTVQPTQAPQPVQPAARASSVETMSELDELEHISSLPSSQVSTRSSMTPDSYSGPYDNELFNAKWQRRRAREQMRAFNSEEEEELLILASKGKDDDEEDDKDEYRASVAMDSTAPGLVKKAGNLAAVVAQKRTLKRAHRAASHDSVSHSDITDGVHAADGSGGDKDANRSTQVRKRRAFVIEDDEDE